MNPRNDRNEAKDKADTREPQKAKRFKLVRLEERIAPAASSQAAITQYCGSHTGNT
jgi:hypothetical protein